MAAKALEVGDRVTVGNTELLGTVKFLGTTEFAAGEWLGIELDEKAGKNDGSVKGKQYFDCKPEHGIFVRPTAVTPVKVSMPAPTALEVPPTTRQSAPPIPRGSGSLVPPEMMKPKRLSQMEIEKAGAQLELAHAIEDHDVEGIRRVLPVAVNLELDPKEIEAAKRILSFEAQQDMIEEVETIRRSIASLARSLAKVEEAAAEPQVAGLLQRLGPELETRLWVKLQPSIDRILTGVLAKVSQFRRTSSEFQWFEAYTFDHFDLNGDGYISREEFEEVRRRILSGEPPAERQVERISEAELQEQQAAASKIQAIYRGRAARDQAAPKQIQDEVPRPRTAEEKALALAVCHSIYARAALRQKVLALGEDHQQAVRTVVRHLLQKAAVKIAVLECQQLSQSVDQQRVEACEGIRSIRASLRRIEEAELRAEEQLNAASTKVQACARGKLARRRKQAVVESTKILQRGFRRLRQRWQQGRKMDFAAVVRAAQGQRKDWAIEFQIEADDAALNQLGFVTAIQKVHQISHGKAEKLWQGFLSQSENSSEQRMGLPIFWAICEAVARGDADAAECADLSLEEYLDGEMEGQYSEEEVQAARRIQAAQRGLNARAQADVTKAMASVSSPEQAAERIQAAFAGRLVREELLEAPVSPDLRAEQAAAAEKIQAVYRGRQVRQEARQAGGLDRRSSQEAAAERIQAAFQGRIQREVFRVEDLTQEEASARIQAVYRGRQAREQAAASMGFRSRQERSRPLPGADLFEEALAKQGGGGELLLQAGFLDMISKAAPEISEFQAQALFEGTCVGTGQMGLSSKLFCELLQAIRLGDEAAAQFADMHIEDYRSLLTADKE